MLAAIISSIANAGSLITDKIALSREQISLKVFLPILFIFLFGFTLILVPMLGRFDTSVALLPSTLFLVFLMIILAVASNALYYEGVQKNKIHHHEIMMMLLPLFTVVLAAIFFPENFDLRIFGLAFVASLALIFAKGSKEHFFIDKDSYNTFLAVILMAAEAIVAKELLYSFSPVALYAIRTLFIAVFFIFYYQPRYSTVKLGHWWIIAGCAVIGVVTVIAQYYAYSSLGIIYTTLVAALAPIIVFLASWEILHEKIKPRVVIAAMVILACVVVATVLQFG